MTDPLAKLHGFYQPDPPAWVPKTVGWYCLFSIVTIAALWIVVREIRRWMLNRYRREALRELRTLPGSEFSALLKRAALSAWPREKVASLTGAEWLAFLSRTMKDAGFLVEPGNQIEELMLDKIDLSDEDEKRLRELTARWIRSHRVLT